MLNVSVSLMSLRLDKVHNGCIRPIEAIKTTDKVSSNWKINDFKSKFYIFNDNKPLVDDFVELRGQRDVGIYCDRFMSVRERIIYLQSTRCFNLEQQRASRAATYRNISFFMQKSCFIMIAVHLANVLWLEMSMLMENLAPRSGLVESNRCSNPRAALALTSFTFFCSYITSITHTSMPWCRTLLAIRRSTLNRRNKCQSLCAFGHSVLQSTRPDSFWVSAMRRFLPSPDIMSTAITAYSWSTFFLFPPCFDSSFSDRFIKRTRLVLLLLLYLIRVSAIQSRAAYSINKYRYLNLFEGVI